MRVDSHLKVNTSTLLALQEAVQAAVDRLEIYQLTSNEVDDMEDAERVLRPLLHFLALDFSLSPLLWHLVSNGKAAGLYQNEAGFASPPLGMQTAEGHI